MDPLNIDDVITIERRRAALERQQLAEPFRWIEAEDGVDEAEKHAHSGYKHAVGRFYVPHTHTCPVCRSETSFTSDPMEDGEPVHCLVCFERESGNLSPELDHCLDCFGNS